MLHVTGGGGDGFRRFAQRYGLPEVGEIRRLLRLWFRQVLAAAQDILIRAMVIAIGAFLLLHVVRALWFVYSHTHVGLTFIDAINPSLAIDIEGLFSHCDFLQLAFHITLGALYACLSVGLLAQLCFAKRYLYDARSFGLKLFWAAGSSLLAAGYLETSLALPFHLAYSLTILAVLMLQPSSFAFASRLVPELNLPALIIRIREAYQLAARRDKES